MTYSRLLLMRERVERRVLSLIPMMRRMSSSLLPSCSKTAKKMYLGESRLYSVSISLTKGRSFSL